MIFSELNLVNNKIVPKKVFIILKKYNNKKYKKFLNN